MTDVDGDTFGAAEVEALTDVDGDTLGEAEVDGGTLGEAEEVMTELVLV